MDTRHKKRIKLIQNLFASSFKGKSNLDEEKREILAKINEKQEEIDSFIKKYAPKYPVDKISKVDLSILRLAIYELLYERKNPPKVVIDEAVTLGREFGTEKSYAFINGVLGSIMKNYTNNDER